MFITVVTSVDLGHPLLQHSIVEKWRISLGRTARGQGDYSNSGSTITGDKTWTL